MLIFFFVGGFGGRFQGHASGVMPLSRAPVTASPVTHLLSCHQAWADVVTVKGWSIHNLATGALGADMLWTWASKGSVVESLDHCPLTFLCLQDLDATVHTSGSTHIELVCGKVVGMCNKVLELLTFVHPGLLATDDFVGLKFAMGQCLQGAARAFGKAFFTGVLEPRLWHLVGLVDESRPHHDVGVASGYFGLGPGALPFLFGAMFADPNCTATSMRRLVHAVGYWLCCGGGEDSDAKFVFKAKLAAAARSGETIAGNPGWRASFAHALQSLVIGSAGGPLSLALAAILAPLCVASTTMELAAANNYKRVLDVLITCSPSPMLHDSANKVVKDKSLDAMVWLLRASCEDMVLLGTLCNQLEQHLGRSSCPDVVRLLEMFAAVFTSTSSLMVQGLLSALVIMLDRAALAFYFVFGKQHEVFMFMCRLFGSLEKWTKRLKGERKACCLWPRKFVVVRITHFAFFLQF